MFIVLLLPFLITSLNAFGQSTDEPAGSWMLSPGILGTIILISIVLLVAALIGYYKVSTLVDKAMNSGSDSTLDARYSSASAYKLKGDELGSGIPAQDNKGVVTAVSHRPENPIVDEKKTTSISLDTPPELRKVILWYMGASAFWLIFGTLIGQYVGMKFVWPEMDTISWLSFGRLRPVHTNTVFWGWASLTMIGLGYFVVARTSNTIIHSYKLAWRGWWLINLSVLTGNIFLMAGINNGGGEYREYIWPVALLFALGLIITFINFYKTIAKRKISEIYISNWYLLGGLVWTIKLATIGYLPNIQNGLGETVIQGYYMHQGVGMWFMTFTLGLVYYYLPSSLNKPIYSYSLGVLAFWTQMLFYTLIGTHHFIFSPLPWWLQTVAIVFSAGMFIPVVAGTTNFLMTMRGSWNEISKSYVLPFFLVGVIFYFVGSTQGSFQAFRFTNYVWHFTDFNVAHSHMTMYGIITFILWACVYAIVPKITGREPKQLFVGIHFWLAFIGLFAYMISMMAGGTFKGMSWIEGKPFIESVILMKPFWVWRAIGGSLMFLSHLMFAYNFYLMVSKTKTGLKTATA
ncbi:MAG: cbb3-type cytochrome c oxidase subunit I [Bacteroidia bacterium]|nr:cbb3-type cytochrome c oxidase subunit I [Bacteroidia bacterium]